MTTHPEQPRPLAMILCDDLIEDKRTHKKTLIGLFSQIVTSRFPATHPKLHIYFALTNGRGKYKATLQQLALEDLKVLKEISGELEFASPNAVLEYDFELVNVTFPTEGKYGFQLLLDGQLLIERVLEVTKSRAPSKGT